MHCSFFSVRKVINEISASSYKTHGIVYERSLHKMESIASRVYTQTSKPHRHLLARGLDIWTTYKSTVFHVLQEAGLHFVRRKTNSDASSLTLSDNQRCHS